MADEAWYKASPIKLADAGFHRTFQEDEVQCSWWAFRQTEASRRVVRWTTVTGTSPLCSFPASTFVLGVGDTTLPTCDWPEYPQFPLQQTGAQSLTRPDRRLTYCPTSPSTPTTHEGRRLDSFNNFPQEKAELVGPMCACGFFYMGLEDAVICYRCGLSRQDWRVGEDDPILEHARVEACLS
nr:hypothetical protein BaRGS_013789 [Batillaria attramentaria]